MAPLTIFFDRSIGTSLPEALRVLGMKSVFHHHSHPLHCGIKPNGPQKSLFAPEEADDVVLSFAGQRNWIVVGHDQNYHTEENILTAIKQHSVGVFYLCGAQAVKWEKMRYFARSYDRLIKLATETQKPFIFKIGYNGHFRKIL